MKIFVMGMHRTGTSMVMGILARCGVYVGKNLLMGARDNPRGHWEERSYLKINDRLMKLNGGSWHNPPTGLNYVGMKGRMRKFLAQWPRNHPVGWKDPRTCYTFPLWYDLIYPEEIKVILTYRPAGEVARSLKARNAIPLKKGAILAMKYTEIGFHNVKRRGVDSMVTHYHSYFENWEVQVRALCEFLNLDFPEDRRGEIAEFIDPKLWHHRSRI